LTKGVLVKKGAFIGPNVITLGANHHREPGYGTVIGGGKTFIGAGTKIAPNIKICADVVTGAMTYVNRDITEPGTYVGAPARKIR
jgi:serine acetyltransferase